ncbi:MAG TPA: excisionase family DNA-binding protein [Steroidobacteraceae bacterium]|nr:excisionase family DNA-binding protein [Steroidobacteraceae bacterium]
MKACIEPVPRFAFSVAEASQSSSLSRRKLYELIDAGHLRTVKIGKRRLVPRDALEQLCRGEECAA